MMKVEDICILEKGSSFVLAVRRDTGNGAGAPWSALTRHQSKEEAQQYVSILMDRSQDRPKHRCREHAADFAKA